MTRYDQMRDGDIYKTVSDRIHGNGAIGGYGVTHLPRATDDHRENWHPAPWYARMFGYKWRRWSEVAIRRLRWWNEWEYGTDKKVAKEFLDREFAPTPGIETPLPLATADPHVKGQLWNNNGVLNISAGDHITFTARRGGQ